jgi:hypothetical protein
MFRGIGRLRAGGGFSYIATLFASTGANGFWFDESYFSTLFQDSAGTTAVTAVEQPIGKILDKSGNGNNATQATAANRMVVSSLDNRLIKTEQFDNVAWTLANTGASLPVVTANSVSAPDGTLTADQIVFPAVSAGQASKIYQGPSTVSTATPYVASIYLRGLVGGEVVNLLGVGTGNVYVSTQCVLTTAWQRFSVAPSSNNTVTYLQLGFDTLAVAGQTTSGITCYAWGGQVNYGTVLKPYQRVDTATVYDASGFPVYASANGTSQNIATTTGGGGTTGFFFCQAIKPAGGAGTARTLFSDRGTNTGYRVGINVSNQLELSAGNGTAFTTIATVATLDVGLTQLVTAYDDGTNLNVQVGGNTVASVARPTVSAGTEATTFPSDNGAATGFFNGNLYPEVYFKNTGLTAAQRLQVQNYCKFKAGL